MKVDNAVCPSFSFHVSRPVGVDSSRSLHIVTPHHRRGTDKRVARGRTHKHRSDTLLLLLLCGMGSGVTHTTGMSLRNI